MVSRSSVSSGAALTTVLLFTLIKLKMWFLHPPRLFLSSSHLIWCCKCSWLGSSSSKRYLCSLIVCNGPLFQELLLFCGFIFQFSLYFIYLFILFPVDLVMRLIFANLVPVAFFFLRSWSIMMDGIRSCDRLPENVRVWVRKMLI